MEKNDAQVQLQIFPVYTNQDKDSSAGFHKCGVHESHHGSQIDLTLAPCFISEGLLNIYV